MWGGRVPSKLFLRRSGASDLWCITPNAGINGAGDDAVSAPQLDLAVLEEEAAELRSHLLRLAEDRARIEGDLARTRQRLSRVHYEMARLYEGDGALPNVPPSTSATAAARDADVDFVVKTGGEVVAVQAKTIQRGFIKGLDPERHRQRTLEGLAARKARGKRLGREPTISQETWAELDRRIEQGMSLRAAALAIGISPSSAQRWVNGYYRKAPSTSPDDETEG